MTPEFLKWLEYEAKEAMDIAATTRPSPVDPDYWKNLAIMLSEAVKEIKKIMYLKETGS